MELTETCFLTQCRHLTRCRHLTLQMVDGQQKKGDGTCGRHNCTIVRSALAIVTSATVVTFSRPSFWYHTTRLFDGNGVNDRK